ncbi:urokinase plasminogen activator surface receptor-like [Sphaerodactylus townsendi]|uniref:urokinase plasminogen activator surface receptor-like n=1 Tax=Sphaerodactylus townsendi TaxID=933632 RepID=UPI002025D87B|nr:urokinase plasminogen activator surface receptor-like [Sphaerodactylus townsendi]
MHFSFWTCFFFLSSLVSHAQGLQCYSCEGESNCLEPHVCREHQNRCRTTVMSTLTPQGLSTYYNKDCDISGKANNSISYLSNNEVVFLAEEHCERELCNEHAPNVLDVLLARGRPKKLMHCYSCGSADGSCFNSSLAQMRCSRPGEQCVDITSFSEPEEFSQDEQHIKGCGQLTHCQEPLGFHNGNSFYLIKCCDSSLCNKETQDYKASPLPLNGVMCYSCEGNFSQGCAPDDITQTRCRGPMNQCLEASGIDGVSGQSLVIKGCASSSWCDSPYTSIYKNLGGLHLRCCTEDLCNSQIVDGTTLKPSPRSQASCNPTAQPVLLLATLLLWVAFCLCSESS